MGGALSIEGATKGASAADGASASPFSFCYEEINGWFLNCILIGEVMSSGLCFR